jgi:hypothetical protein
MDAQKIKREYTPPMARVIGARMVKGANKPTGVCTSGANPVGQQCLTGTGFGFPPFDPPFVDHCTSPGSSAVLVCRSGGSAN